MPSIKKSNTLFFVFDDELFVNKLHGVEFSSLFPPHQIHPGEATNTNAFDELEVLDCNFGGSFIYGLSHEGH